MLAPKNVGGQPMWHNRSAFLQAAQKGQTSHPPNPGAPRRALSPARPQAYPLGYVEDLFKARTKLEDFFSILQDRGDSGSEERGRQLQTTRS